MKLKDIRQTFVIGGLNIVIRSPQNLPFLNDDRFDPFRGDTTAADICWDYQIILPADLILPPLDPESDTLLAQACRIGRESPLLAATQVKASLEQAREHADQLVVEMHQEAVTILDFSTHRADMFFNPDFGNQLRQHCIGPAMLALFMPHFSAMLLHASAVVRKGKTAVFLAPDEGGKTTAARNSPEGTILCDDQVLVRQTHGGFQASGTPWGLYCNSKLQAPLSGLFLLEKSGHFALNPLPPKELSRYLWEEHKNQLAILPPPLQAKAREITVAISNSVPSWKLSFSKDTIDWEAIDNAMAL
ncbi:MAG: hypothetical protein NTW95_04005 [Candidatus Aminicenantes bacterium]|nr:hypothetical protein [Candidatus Aminicenantes bacterium]